LINIEGATFGVGLLKLVHVGKLGCGSRLIIDEANNKKKAHGRHAMYNKWKPCMTLTKLCCIASSAHNNLRAKNIVMKSLFTQH